MWQIFNFLEFIKCEEDPDLPFAARMFDGEYCDYLKPEVRNRRVRVNLFSKLQTEILDIRVKYHDKETGEYTSTNYRFSVRSAEK